MLHLQETCLIEARCGVQVIVRAYRAALRVAIYGRSAVQAMSRGQPTEGAARARLLRTVAVAFRHAHAVVGRLAPLVARSDREQTAGHRRRLGWRRARRGRRRRWPRIWRRWRRRRGEGEQTRTDNETAVVDRTIRSPRHRRAAAHLHVEWCVVRTVHGAADSQIVAAICRREPANAHCTRMHVFATSTWPARKACACAASALYDKPL